MWHCPGHAVCARSRPYHIMPRRLNLLKEDCCCSGSYCTQDCWCDFRGSWQIPISLPLYFSVSLCVSRSAGLLSRQPRLNEKRKNCNFCLSPYWQVPRHISCQRSPNVRLPHNIALLCSRCRFFCQELQLCEALRFMLAGSIVKQI